MSMDATTDDENSYDSGTNAIIYGTSDHSREMSMDTTTDDEYSFDSDTNAIIYGTPDHSGESMISGPNILSSSSSTSEDDEYQQQITIATGHVGTDDLIVSSSASSKQSQHQEIRIFNVDFRALSRVAACSTGNKGLESNNRLKSFARSEIHVGSNKRLKSFARSEFLVGLLPDIAGTVNKETRARLVNYLMACAEEIQENNLSRAYALIRDIRILAISQIGSFKDVATYFAEALDHKIHEMNPHDIVEPSYYPDELSYMSFYDISPYLKFAHFTANQAILKAFTDCDHVHVIDFGFNQGCQWPALTRALALRPGGPPSFRLTGIGPPQPDNTDALQEVGWKLAQLAETFGVEFEFRGFVVDSLADLDASMLDIRRSDGEAVAVNSVFKLHRLLSKPGAIEKVLNLIKQIQPKIVTIAEQEASHNTSVFTDRFNEALHYYSTIFDSLENSESSTQSTTRDLEMAGQYLGREIYNLVACEGTMRVVRHETLSQWRVRMHSAGFNPVHFDSNAYRQAVDLFALFANREGYRIEENDGCLMLSWHNRPLTASSAWQLMSPSLGKSVKG